MGLDYLELLLEVEERFAISVEDEEVLDIRTVGDLCDLVKSKLQPSASRDCLTSHVFYQFRCVFGSEFGVPREAVVPASDVESLVPQSQRRRAWRALSERLQWDLPDLKRAGWLERGLIAGFIAAILSVIVGSMSDHLSQAQAWALGISALPAFFLMHLMTEPLAIHIPENCGTVGLLAKTTLGLNFRRIAEAREAWNEQELWQAIQDIVVDQLGVKASQITPDTDFVKDLGF